MPGLTISEVARQVGFRPSAIRYYEQIGLLPPAQRMGGQRRYDFTVLYRLAVVQRARQLGFTLDEIRQLFCGFRTAAPASERWQTLSRRKLAELDDLMSGIKAMQKLLGKMMKNCHCETLDQCGKGIFQRDCANSAVRPPSMNPRERLKNIRRKSDSVKMDTRKIMLMPSALTAEGPCENLLSGWLAFE